MLLKIHRGSSQGGFLHVSDPVQVGGLIPDIDVGVYRKPKLGSDVKL